MTCPACGLANEPGARVCRNCGLPIASAGDPLRGVKPGRVDLPSAQRSGLSATVGLALVVGLLLVGGTLAVSGGGILNSGGRLVDSGGDASPGADVDGAADDEGQGQLTPPDGTLTGATDPGSTETGDGDPGGIGTSFDFTCENGSIRDLGRSKWFLSQFRAGERLSEEGDYDRVTWEMSQRGSSGKGTTATMEWTTPREARATYGADLVSGTRAIVVTFDGPVEITVEQQIDELLLEPENVVQVRTIDMFEGADGKVRTVIGVRGESCARMSSMGWTKKAKTRNGRVYLDVEKF